jgi:hypothetical protein
VVDDAELKQIRNRHVKAWLDAVKDVVFQAEDLLDEIDIEVFRCNLEVESESNTGKVWNFFNASSNSFDEEIESKMQEVLENLDYLASKKDILGLKEASTSCNQVYQKLPSTSLPVDSVIYGRDVDKEVICDWLISDAENDKPQLSIVSIVGMGGIGKTTLAQHLYNDPKMEDTFDIKACWKLFCKHAFLDENPQINPDFKDIAKRILKKCQGLPLSLKTIGSLLYTKPSLVEWESILGSEIWDLPEEESNIIPALILSYHHLPSHLKRCFAYCALFPKNYVFQKEHLILLWMSENFLQCPRQNISMEEVGEQYFNDLFSRSFFQQSREHKIHFVMHDVLNDLAKYVCGEFCFTFKDEESQNVLKMTRHISFLRNPR